MGWRLAPAQNQEVEEPEMLLIPAIDLKDGHCVRLRQGRMEESTVFSEDPVEMAGRWVEAGARRLHIVDLNGAFAGEPVNADVINRICEAFPELSIQVGGGIRSEETIQTYLDAGVNFVILGTRAVNAPHFVSDVCMEFPGHIIVGLDAKDGDVAVDGWSKLSGHNVVDLAKRFEDDGVEAIIYTDIARDGMLNGVNVEATVKLAQSDQHSGHRLRRHHQYGGYSRPLHGTREGHHRRHHRSRPL